MFVLLLSLLAPLATTLCYAFQSKCAVIKRSPPVLPLSSSLKSYTSSISTESKKMTEYMQQLKIVSPSEVTAMRFDPVDPTARDQASAILKDVRENGIDGLLTQAAKLGDIPSKDAKYTYSQEELADAFKSLDSEQQVCMPLLPPTFFAPFLKF